MVESLAVELCNSNNEVDWMFAEKVQCVGFELVFDTVGKASRTNEMKRRGPMQADAQESIEASKVIHVSVRNKGMADAQEVAR